ncbi:YheC/YheD family protein [Paenibacillus sp. GCM10027626]|uniref:YheC/YheD family protein n=1 Tax=Paenibacillus sp. GCM10027626 TaxID=3273411 RepID=UPI0036287CB8
MKKTTGRYLGDKWIKTKALLQDKELQALVPDTKRMSATSLRRMLNRYSMVYIKPVLGSFGNGVMRVEQSSGSRGTVFTYQLDRKKRTFKSFDSMYQSILKNKKNGPYLVQKGVQLLKHKGRRFDIRVMVQRNAKMKWETTGIIGRVAHPSKIITNYHGGGTPKPVISLLKPHLGAAKVLEFERILAKVGEKAARALSRKYPYVSEIGADVGVDTDIKPWIIELNTKPDPYIFRHLKKRSVYRKVLRYHKTNLRMLRKARRNSQ